MVLKGPKGGSGGPPQKLFSASGAHAPAPPHRKPPRGIFFYWIWEVGVTPKPPGGATPVQGAGVLMRRKSIIEKWLNNEPPAAPHLWVAGGSGMGKTTLVRALSLHILERGERVFIIDYDGEYSEIPLIQVKPPFPIVTDADTLAWLLSQAARPEEGGYTIELHLQRIFEKYSVNGREEFKELMRIIEVDSLPYHIRQAIQWRLFLFQKYFIIKNEPAPLNGAGVVYNLSPIRGGRSKETVQHILVTYLLSSSSSSTLIVEEAPVGPFLRDILMEARRKGLRLIMVSQQLPEPEYMNNFELLLFTPYNYKVRLPIPVDPAVDRGVWWVGRLGVKRINIG